MKKEIISQYKASLKMLLDIINKCPQELWKSNEYKNPYWRIVYHTLYYASLYLEPKKFTPWEKHKENYHRFGSATEEIYSKNEMLEYAETIFNNCESLVNNASFVEKSGIDWFHSSKGELHLYNIRHIQHHTGQLIERLRQNGIKGIKWESMFPEYRVLSP